MHWGKLFVLGVSASSILVCSCEAALCEAVSQSLLVFAVILLYAGKTISAQYSDNHIILLQNQRLPDDCGHFNVLLSVWPPSCCSSLLFIAAGVA